MSVKTHDIGRYFYYVLPTKVNPGTPLTHVALSWEREPPYRESETRVLRLWPTRLAVAWGYWYDTGVESIEEQDERMGMVRPYKRCTGVEGAAWEDTEEEEWA